MHLGRRQWNPFRCNILSESYIIRRIARVTIIYILCTYELSERFISIKNFLKKRMQRFCLSNESGREITHLNGSRSEFFELFRIQIPFNRLIRRLCFWCFFVCIVSKDTHNFIGHQINSDPTRQDFFFILLKIKMLKRKTIVTKMLAKRSIVLFAQK